MKKILGIKVHMGKRLLTMSVLTVMFLISVFLVSLAAASPADIVALKTEEHITVNGIADEGFWSRIPATKVTLTGSNEYGGHVESVTIKAAHNGTYLFILATWTDATEDRTGERAKPGDLPGQYVYNETFYYEDHLILEWWMGEGTPTITPVAVDAWGDGIPENTKKEGMIANLWTWGATDTDSGGPTRPYPDAYPQTYRWGPHEGEPLIYPYSFARNSFLNSTGNWHIGTGLLHGGGACDVDRREDRPAFTVRARGIWESRSWTLEVARPFTTAAVNVPYSIQFEEGQTYSVAFAAYDGYQGEVEETNSISDWKTIELSSQYTYLEQDVLDATQAAIDAAQAADEAKRTAEVATTIAYASIAVAVVAIIVAAVSVFITRKKTSSSV